MSGVESVTIRELIEAQEQRLRSNHPIVRMLDSFLHSGDVGAQLTRLSDRQIGQLMFDYVGGDFGFGSPEASICNEATERLFRSSAGARLSERFNVPGHLPACPRCGDEMMHFIGIDEPDFRQCVVCGNKTEEANG